MKLLEVQNDLNELEAANRKMQRERDVLKDRVAQLEELRPESPDAALLQSQESELQDKAEEMSALKATISSLNEDNSSLREEVGALQALQAADQDTALLGKTLAQSQEIINELEEREKQLQERVEELLGEQSGGRDLDLEMEVATLEEEVAELKEREKELLTQIEDQQGRGQSEMQERETKLYEQLEEREQLFVQLEEREKALKTQLEDREGQQQEADAMILAKADALGTQLSTLKELLVAKEEESAELQAKLGENTIAMLESQNELNEAKEAQRKIGMQLGEANMEWAKKLEEAEKKVATPVKKEKQSKREKKREKEHSEERAALKKQLAGLEVALGAKEKDAQKERQEAEAAREEAEELATMKAMAARVEAEHTAGEALEEKNKELEMLSAELAGVRTELQQLQDAAGEEEAESRVAGLLVPMTPRTKGVQSAAAAAVLVAAEGEVEAEVAAEAAREEVAKLKEQLDANPSELQAQVSSLEGQLQEQRAQLDRTCEQLKEQGEAMRLQGEASDALEAKLGENTIAMLESQNELNEAKEAQRKAGEAVQALQVSLEEAEQRLAKQEQKTPKMKKAELVDAEKREKEREEAKQSQTKVVQLEQELEKAKISLAEAEKKLAEVEAGTEARLVEVKTEAEAATITVVLQAKTEAETAVKAGVEATAIKEEEYKAQVKQLRAQLEQERNAREETGKKAKACTQCKRLQRWLEKRGSEGKGSEGKDGLAGLDEDEREGESGGEELSVDLEKMIQGVVADLDAQKIVTEESKQAAEESKQAAEESKQEAEESKQAAEESKQAAEESKKEAEESKQEAEESKQEAEESKQESADAEARAVQLQVASEERERTWIQSQQQSAGVTEMQQVQFEAMLALERQLGAANSELEAAHAAKDELKAARVECRALSEELAVANVSVGEAMQLKRAVEAERAAREAADARSEELERVEQGLLDSADEQKQSLQELEVMLYEKLDRMEDMADELQAEKMAREGAEARMVAMEGAEEEQARLADETMLDEARAIEAYERDQAREEAQRHAEQQQQQQLQRMRDQYGFLHSHSPPGQGRTSAYGSPSTNAKHSSRQSPGQPKRSLGKGASPATNNTGGQLNGQNRNQSSASDHRSPHRNEQHGVITEVRVTPPTNPNMRAMPRGRGGRGRQLEPEQEQEPDAVMMGEELLARLDSGCWPIDPIHQQQRARVQAPPSSQPRHQQQPPQPPYQPPRVAPSTVPTTRAARTPGPQGTPRSPIKRLSWKEQHAARSAAHTVSQAASESMEEEEIRMRRRRQREEEYGIYAQMAQVEEEKRQWEAAQPRYSGSTYSSRMRSKDDEPQPNSSSKQGAITRVNRTGNNVQFVDVGGSTTAIYSERDRKVVAGADTEPAIVVGRAYEEAKLRESSGRYIREECFDQSSTYYPFLAHLQQQQQHQPLSIGGEHQRQSQAERRQISEQEMKNAAVQSNVLFKAPAHPRRREVLQQAKNRQVCHISLLFCFC
jgi:hypothetical protein